MHSKLKGYKDATCEIPKLIEGDPKFYYNFRMEVQCYMLLFSIFDRFYPFYCCIK